MFDTIYLKPQPEVFFYLGRKNNPRNKLKTNLTIIASLAFKPMNQYNKTSFKANPQSRNKKVLPNQVGKLQNLILFVE